MEEGEEYDRGIRREGGYRRSEYGCCHQGYAIAIFTCIVMVVFRALWAPQDGAQGQSTQPPQPCHGFNLAKSDPLQVEAIFPSKYCGARGSLGDTLHVTLEGKLFVTCERFQVPGRHLLPSLDTLHVFTLGSGSMLPELEQELVGQCEGSVVRVTFPNRLGLGYVGDKSVASPLTSVLDELPFNATTIVLNVVILLVLTPAEVEMEEQARNIDKLGDKMWSMQRRKRFVHAHREHVEDRYAQLVPD
ncbi:unnamed protein product [Choristocarpus tenellus]